MSEFTGRLKTPLECLDSLESLATREFGADPSEVAGVIRSALDERAEMQAAIKELQRALELAREQMQEFANYRMERGYVTPWTPALETADDVSEQALNNTKKWSETDDEI